MRNMKVRSGKFVIGPSGENVPRDSDTGRFLLAAQKMKKIATSSPAAARKMLKDMGILTSKGRLSKNYK